LPPISAFCCFIESCFLLFSGFVMSTRCASPRSARTVSKIICRRNGSQHRNSCSTSSFLLWGSCLISAFSIFYKKHGRTLECSQSALQYAGLWVPIAFFAVELPCIVWSHFVLHYYICHLFLVIRAFGSIEATADVQFCEEGFLCSLFP
jgi:hypothetical protein